jgi:hypothetical protein
VTHPAARLAFLFLLALAVRAASGQQPEPQRYPLNVARPEFRFGSTTPQTSAPSPPGDAQRYPLPAPRVAPPQVLTPDSRPPIPDPRLPAPNLSAQTGDLFQPAQIVATVGNKFIFYGDVAPIVAQALEPAFAKAESDFERSQIEKYREPLIRQTIRQMVETKLMYIEFEREVMKNAPKDKLAEVRKNIDKKVSESFEQELAEMRTKIAKAKPEEIQELVKRDPIVPRLALLMRDSQAESLAELDAALRRFGSTLDKEVRYYGEYKLGRSTVGKHINFNPEITHQEMLDYYREHAADYAVPAKARFEILTARYSNYPTVADAVNAVGAMGNEVYFGVPFAAVAKRSSQEPNAQAGGYYDWTSQGSLASKPIDEALFSIDVGKLSQVIHDDRGCHIVRVIERSPAGQISFLEAQTKIKEAIKIQKREADYKKFVQQLGSGTKVWTVYDDATVTARQPTGSQPR